MVPVSAPSMWIERNSDDLLRIAGSLKMQTLFSILSAGIAVAFACPYPKHNDPSGKRLELVRCPNLGLVQNLPFSGNSLTVPGPHYGPSSGLGEHGS
jgi:hypothetical protein